MKSNFLLLLVMVFLIAGCSTTKKSYFPATEWKYSTPKEQGMDSQMLAKMFEFLIKEKETIQSIVVLRNGYIVAEGYQYPYKEEDLHHIHSCTKGFTSALVGIAINEGYLKSENVKVTDIFPGKNIANMDAYKKGLSVKHLLTMTAGLNWNESYDGSPTSSFTLIRESKDWVQYILDSKMLQNPGTEFYYSSGASHLLSGIIQEATGETTLDFARDRLFNPLGIAEYYWQTDPRGIAIGGWGLWMNSRDMAKFGLLYLNNGKWGDKQIIPSDWVSKSKKTQVKVPGSEYNYGYQWWIDSKEEFYTAWGYGGQIITIFPKINLVMVITSMLPLAETRKPIRIANTFVTNAVKSDSALPPNEENYNRLIAATDAYEALPEIINLKELPEMAQKISGKTYIYEENKFHFISQELKFDPNDLTKAKLIFNDSYFGEVMYEIGLDNSYSINKIENYVPRLLKGTWQDESTFVMMLHDLGSYFEVRITMKFSGDTLSLTLFDTINKAFYIIKGEVQKD